MSTVCRICNTKLPKHISIAYHVFVYHPMQFIEILGMVTDFDAKCYGYAKQEPD